MKEELCESERREQTLEEQVEQMENDLARHKEEIDNLESTAHSSANTIAMLREELELSEKDKDQLRIEVFSIHW